MSIVRTGWMSDNRPAIGMVHLQPLPGSPACEEPLPTIITAALHDAETLVEGGMDGLLIENFGDAPFYPDRVPPVTIASMTAVAVEIRRRFDVPLGINVLRNDGRSALAISLACGANFIRVNILCGARVTDQGVIEGHAHRLLRERQRLGVEAIHVWADVQVKHSGPLAPRPLREEVEEVIQRGFADAVIITGPRTSQPASVHDLSEAKEGADGVPVLVGSGVAAENLGEWTSLADGFIVGSSLKRDGQPRGPVDLEAVKRFVAALRNH
jgi:membrane complex biogenesis BtpA family protein